MEHLKNIFACLVHEKQECVVDLVRNLSSLDPSSRILLYNGGMEDELFNGFPFEKYGVTIVPGSRPLKWGWLHDFALDCMKYADAHFPFDLITIVDSDQLAIGRNYSRFMSEHLEKDSKIGMFGITEERQFSNTKVDPAITAYQEEELWKPFLQKFPEGLDKFLYWTFWPSTAFTHAAANDLVRLFETDMQLKEILKKTQIWASEEIILPTLVSLLGYKIKKNPCSYNYVKYREQYTVEDIETAILQQDAFWVHPVPREANNPLRTSIAGHFQFYKREEPNRGKRPCDIALTDRSRDNNRYISHLSISKEIQSIDGWLEDDEAELLFHASYDILKEKARNTDVVEIGSYCGKATILLGDVVRELGNVSTKVYAIDLFNGEVGALDRIVEKKPPCFSIFMNNINQSGLTHIVQPLICRSFQIDYWETPVGFLLIDGLHDYTNVARDFYSFEKWVINGGYIAFHDYVDYFPGVKTFVDELLSSGNYRKVAGINTLILLEKISVESLMNRTLTRPSPTGIKKITPQPLTESSQAEKYNNSKLPVVMAIILFCILSVLVFRLFHLVEDGGRVRLDIPVKTHSRNREIQFCKEDNAPVEKKEFKLFAFKKRYPLFEKIVENVFKEAVKNELSPYTVLSVVQVESNFDPSANSNVAYGLMQINLKVWKDFFNIDENRIYDIDYNIAIGCQILKHYLDETGGNLVKALFHYNNGYLYNNETYVPKVLGSIYAKDGKQWPTSPGI